MGEEVVDDQHPLARLQVAGGDGDGALHLLGEGVHLCAQQRAGERQRLLLAREHQRHAQRQCGHQRRGDARDLDGHHLVDALVAEAASEFGADPLHQHGIDLMVEEGVDLQHLLGEHDAVLADLLFQLFHGAPLAAVLGRCSPLSVGRDPAPCIVLTLWRSVVPAAVRRILARVFSTYPRRVVLG
ncbi:hypothetical protein D9M71_485340 [compost metagenome]